VKELPTLLRSNARKLELNVQQLANWGRALGEELSSPLFIQLAGDLGAGKTTLAAAICAGYGVSATVTSPTFSLINRYDGARGPVYHVDLLRHPCMARKTRPVKRPA
jgi:tRNA threonylcarbamoyladenosine biosynthesis protein TsaE